jgi:hypothetical protein
LVNMFMFPCRSGAIEPDARSPQVARYERPPGFATCRLPNLLLSDDDLIYLIQRTSKDCGVGIVIGAEHVLAPTKSLTGSSTSRDVVGSRPRRKASLESPDAIAADPKVGRNSIPVNWAQPISQPVIHCH